MKEKDRSSHCCSNCINVPKLTDARKGNKDRSSRSAQTASMYLSSSASLLNLVYKNK